MGLLLTQIIKLRGGHVIGRVSSEEKVAVAKDAGADHVIVDTEGRFAEEALRLTRGEGVHVVYDGSGPTSFQGSLDVLRPSGTFCWYGPVLGGPGPLNIMKLPKSIKIGFAVFRDHINTPELFRACSAQLFDWIAKGKLKIRIGGEYRLADAAKAHADMESRKTTGKLLLVRRAPKMPSSSAGHEVSVRGSLCASRRLFSNFGALRFETVHQAVTASHHRLGRQIEHIPPQTMFALSSYQWPGNIRELQNLIERAVILSNYGVLPNPLPAAGTQTVAISPAATTLRDSERALILNTLEAAGWVIGEAKGQPPSLA